MWRPSRNAPANIVPRTTTIAAARAGVPSIVSPFAGDQFFWAERLREERYAYSDEELRPYFSLPRVLEGLFATAKRLFDVDIRPAEGDVPVAAAVGSSWFAFIHYSMLINPVYASATALVIYFACSLLGYLRTRSGSTWLPASRRRSLRR